MNNLLDKLADKEHKRWAHWQKYLHSKCKKLKDGSLLIPADLVKHWEEQVNTDYKDLDKKEKESDKDQVKKYLPIIKEYYEDSKYIEQALFSNKRKSPRYILKDIMDLLYKNGLNKYKTSLIGSLKLRGIEYNEDNAKALIRDPRTDMHYIIKIEKIIK